MSAFSEGTKKLVPAVLVYLFHENQILMMNRNQKKDDIHQGKWNGLGGKMEHLETPMQASLREMKEEAGVELNSSTLCHLGVLHFPDFKKEKNEDWLVYLFRADVMKKPDVFEQCEEGELSWIDQNKVLELPLWEGDQVFLPYVLEKKPVSGTFFYENKKLVRYDLYTLPSSKA